MEKQLEKAIKRITDSSVEVVVGTHIFTFTRMPCGAYIYILKPENSDFVFGFANFKDAETFAMNWDNNHSSEFWRSLWLTSRSLWVSSAIKEAL